MHQEDRDLGWVWTVVLVPAVRNAVHLQDVSIFCDDRVGLAWVPILADQVRLVEDERYYFFIGEKC